MCKLPKWQQKNAARPGVFFCPKWHILFTKIVISEVPKLKHTRQKINLVLGIVVLAAVLMGMAYYFSGMENSMTFTRGTLI